MDHSRGSAYVEVAHRLAVLFTIEARLFSTLRVAAARRTEASFSTISMESILPVLTQLHDFAESITRKPASPKLTVACVQLLETTSFFFPEQRSASWKRIWECMLLACREKASHPDVSVACLKSLALLCPLMLESFPQCGPDIRELLSSAVISEELKESGGVLVSRLTKRRKEHSGTSKYGTGGAGA